MRDDNNNENGKPLKAVIYARVSTEGQAEEEVPLTAQVRECQEFAASKGWQVVDVFKDGGISGRTDERPAFQQMMTQTKEKPKPFDVIVDDSQLLRRRPFFATPPRTGRFVPVDQTVFLSETSQRVRSCLRMQTNPKESALLSTLVKQPVTPEPLIHQHQIVPPQIAQ